MKILSLIPPICAALNIPVDRLKLPPTVRGDLPEMGNEYNGAFWIGHMLVIASSGGKWDHVSVSCENRTPTWEEMDKIKRIFFLDHETAMQLHVPVANHINIHPHVLHLWRPHKKSILLPPKNFV